MRSRFWQVVVLATVLATGCSSGDGRDLAVPSGAESTPAPSTEVAAAPSTSTTDLGSSSTISPTIDADSTDRVIPMTAPGVEPQGFGTVAASITSAAGEVCEVCLWVADTSALRRRGLMEVTDLGIGDGMVFRYENPRSSTSFWMQNTPMPLTIAFFDAAGGYMESFDMEPCLSGTCPRYSTPHGFLDAIEFPHGTLTDFGVGPGSVLEIGDLPCGE